MTDQDKAVALATQYGVRRHGEEEGLVYDYFEFYAPQLTAMLTDHDSQVRADERQRLVDASGVMPAIYEFENNDTLFDYCEPPAVCGAIASLQAEVEQAEEKYLVERGMRRLAERKLEQSEQRVRELEKDAADFAKHIAKESPLGDNNWACARCRPNSEILKPGWFCVVHRAIDFDAAMKKENG